MLQLCNQQLSDGSFALATPLQNGGGTQPSSLSFTLYVHLIPQIKACLRNSFFDEPLQWILLFQTDESVWLPDPLEPNCPV